MEVVVKKFSYFHVIEVIDKMNSYAHIDKTINHVIVKIIVLSLCFLVNSFIQSFKKKRKKGIITRRTNTLRISNTLFHIHISRLCAISGHQKNIINHKIAFAIQKTIMLHHKTKEAYIVRLKTPFLNLTDD